jgi:hypothetical protein
MSEYLYDVFLSYRRAGNVAGWVETHLTKVLSRCLQDELDYEPKIFVDKQIETGAFWPDELENALRRSRLMVAVLSPPYFTSKWCRAEWKSMELRENIVEMDSGLIFPVVFSDGDSFNTHVERRQCRSMKDWSYPYPQFAEAPAFLQFHDKVREFAIELVGRLDKVPQWSPDWPVERPDFHSQPPRAYLPEL